MGGDTCIASVRAPQILAPHILVIEDKTEVAKTEALKAGAGDYLSRPFGLPDLLWHIRRALPSTGVP